MAFVFCKVLEKHSLAEVRIVWVYGYTLLFSVALFPVLAGYVDIVGMLPLTSSFLLVIDREFEQVDIAKDICLGASLLWVMLLRRYYAYAVVGGAVFAFFYWFTYGATFKKPFFRLKNKIIDMLLSIAVPVIVLVTVFPNYIIRSLLNNHSSAYSAYKTAGLVGEWIKFARYFGIFFIALMIVGVLYGIWRKAGRLTVGLLLNLAVTCTLFFRIQNMGQHHYYIAVFPMCCLIFLGVYALLSVCTKEAFLAWGVRSLIVFVIVGNFLMSIGIGTSYKSALWVERTYVPRVRSDFEALRDLEKCLEDLSDEGFHRVYCTASSVIFNNSIIYNLNAPDKNPKISWAGVSHVDLRDGFNTQFFESDIIVACNPPQSHLQHGQEVVLRLNEVMMTENIFSRNYEIRNEYILDRGVHAVVFVKKEPLERSEIEYIQDIFEGLYPGYPELFSERINTYLNEKY